MKLKKGYNVDIINNYNESVINRIKNVSKILEIPEKKFSPKDNKGNKHTLGLFENDGGTAQKKMLTRYKIYVT